MNNRVPPWVGKLVLGTFITATIAGSLTWAQSLTTAANNHDKEIAVMKTEQVTLRRDITEIKDGQQRIEDKLDRAIERR
jgi:uncharacterized membrane protein